LGDTRRPVDQRAGLEQDRAELRWSLFTCYLHDFAIVIGPVKKVLKEAVAVVQHRISFTSSRTKPGYKLEVAIGYPFIDWAPIPNYFGFGPGKFDWAVKTFMFLLRGQQRGTLGHGLRRRRAAKKVFDFR
jgi:hypothetical protein